MVLGKLPVPGRPTNCLACEAKARHMYFFSGVDVVGGGGDVNFVEFCA